MKRMCALGALVSLLAGCGSSAGTKQLTVGPARTYRLADFGPVQVEAGEPERLSLLDMEMGVQSYQLTEVSPGLYERTTPALVMVGHWGLAFELTPPLQQPFTVQFVDRATG